MKSTFGIAQSQLTRESPRAGARAQDRKVSYVRQLFSDGTQEYDFLLKILSLGRDYYWRNSIIEKSKVKSGDLVLDIACGTGLVTYAFGRNRARVIGIDVTMEMIRRAMTENAYRTSDVDFVLARAENLPLRSDSFDASTISLALRNVSSQVETLAEMKRCTRKGKIVLSLDFSRPRNRFFKPFYDFYTFNVLPALGLLISRHWNTIFLYLANSIEKSRDPEQIVETMRSIGLSNPSATRFTHGVTALVSGTKS